MSKKVNIENLSAEIASTISDYTKKVSQSIEKEVDASAKQLLNEVRANAPKKTGGYAKGFKTKKVKRQGEAVRILHNAKKPGLVHLLELGHAKRSGGRVASRPHLRPAYDRMEPAFLRRIENIIKNGG